MKEYRTIHEVSGPLMVVDHVEGVTYDELAEIQLHSGEVRRCKVLEVNGDRAVVQLFDSSASINLRACNILPDCFFYKSNVDRSGFPEQKIKRGMFFKIIVSDLIVSFQRQLLRIILTNKLFGDLLRDLPLFYITFPLFLRSVRLPSFRRIIYDLSYHPGI